MQFSVIPKTLNLSRVPIKNFHSSIFVAIPMLKSPVCPATDPEQRERIVGFIQFPSVFVLYEMKTESFGL